MLGAMARMGCIVEKHHHEVASAQHELGLKFSPLVVMADRMQIYKYCITQVAQIYGKTATFMPKPVYGDNGSGMHCHQSIWKDGKPVFAGNKYADLSETCLSYIAGIIKHAKAINAFTNPDDELVQAARPGFEAPGAARLFGAQPLGLLPHPYTTNPKAKRVEVRFPDPLANPYLGFAAMLMAGMDGVKNKLDPARRSTRTSTTCRRQELKQIPTVCGSLRQALEELSKDPRLPQGRRRVRRRLHRQLHRPEDDRGDPLRAHPASGRVRDVLFGVASSQHRSRRCQLQGRPRAPFSIAVRADAGRRRPNRVTQRAPDISVSLRCSAVVQIEVVERHIASGRIGNLRCPQTTKRDSIGPVIERLTRNWRAASSSCSCHGSSPNILEYSRVAARSSEPPKIADE
jgi:hypothetical protein